MKTILLRSLFIGVATFVLMSLSDTSIRKHVRIGILGGMGPHTSSHFALDIIKEYYAKKAYQPNIILSNIRQNATYREQLIRGEFSSEFLSILLEGITQLNSSGADYIAIPCNTVHFYLDTLRSLSATPIFSIMEESAHFMSQKGYAKVGILGTALTLKQGLHKHALKEKDIQLLQPKNTHLLDEILERIFENQFTHQDKLSLQNMIKDLGNQGAEAVILGCTDIQEHIKQSDSALPLVDTFEVLKRSCLKKLYEGI